MDFAREIKKAMEHESYGNTNCNWRARNDPKRLNKGAERDGHRTTSRDHPNYCIPEIGQNTEKNPRDLRSLAFTQTPVKDHQLTQVYKNSGGTIIIQMLILVKYEKELQT